MSEFIDQVDALKFAIQRLEAFDTKIVYASVSPRYFGPGVNIAYPTHALLDWLDSRRAEIRVLPVECSALVDGVHVYWPRSAEVR